MPSDKLRVKNEKRPKKTTKTATSKHHNTNTHIHTLHENDSTRISEGLYMLLNGMKIYFIKNRLNMRCVR